MSWVALVALLWIQRCHSQLITEGCRVEDLQFARVIGDSVHFSAFVPDDGNIFNIKLACANNNFHYDTLNATTDSASLVRVHSREPKTENWTTPQFEEGWDDFTLRLTDTFNLVSKGSSWFPEDAIPLQCKINNVSVSGGVLATYCPSRTFKWDVFERKCAGVPVALGKGDAQLALTLSSRQSFSPFFRIGGTEVDLTVRDGGLVTSQNGSTPSLPPSTYQLLIEFSATSEGVMTKMLTSEKKLLRKNFQKNLREFDVCVKRNSSFVLIVHFQKLHGNGEAHSYHDYRNIIILCQSVVIAIGIIVVAILCLRRKPANEPANASRPAGEPASTEYLEPNVVQQREMGTTSEQERISEHIYEVVDEHFTTSVQESPKPSVHRYSSDSESKLSEHLYVNDIR